jgi:hypothetical protein
VNLFTRLGPAALLTATVFAAACNADAATRKPALASPNWAGYVATPLADVPAVFTRAIGTWREPKVVCSRGDAGAAAAIWIGIGGYAGSGELQQIGSTVGCDGHDQPVATAWFDLYPYPEHAIPLQVRPGDTLTGDVTVSPTAVGLELRDQTRRWRFVRTIDWLSSGASSAEWVVEAPLECMRSVCAQARLADFGSLTFTQIGASASTTTGTLRCRAWTATPVQLDPAQPATPPAPTGDAPRTESAASAGTPAAFPSVLDADGSTFTITWLADMTALPPVVSGY